MLSSRFLSNVALLLVGGALAIVSRAVSSSLTGWVTLGVSLGVLAVLGAAQADRSRQLAQRGLDACSGALALWSAVASVVFDGRTLGWLSFGEALGFAGIALIGLIVHEQSSERVVHAFEALPSEARTLRRSEEYQAAA
jgi:hypothetical protein